MRGILRATLLALLCISSSLYASDAANRDIARFSSCEYCGMSRSKFAHNRMLIEYQNGTSIGTCSLHCTAVEFALQIDKIPAAIMVGEFNTKQLLNAETAIWVLGGEKPGVMTSRGKWAFGNRDAAEKFLKENGGELVDFESAMHAAYEDMYFDTRMIRKKRQAKRLKRKAQATTE